MGKTAGMVELPVASLVPYERNAKLHPQDQVEKIAASIREFGFLSPCLVDRAGNIIAGHGRVEAAKSLGMETVPCVYVDGLSEEQRRAYILADNRLTELGGWDWDIVKEEAKALVEGGFDINLTGFTADEILFEEDEDAFEEETEPDIPKDIITTPGEVWVLGDHRLVCGDSANEQTIELLMDGEKADLLMTDPPYNIGLGIGDSPEIAKARRRRGDGLKIENDMMGADEFEDFLASTMSIAAKHMKAGAAYYCWYASTSQRGAQTALERAGLPPREVLIWVKNTLSLGRADYQWRHEPCFYGWKEGAAHYFIDARSLTTIFDDIDSCTREKAIERLKEWSSMTTAIYENKPVKSELHPTMKPLALFKKMIRNSSKEGDIVLDIFGGAGTTLIACEEMGRACRMAELDPVYATATIRRWEEATGRKAEKA